jgi:large subunit ribosomal protein L3
LKAEIMPVGLLGRKIGMTQIYNDDGDISSATVIEAGPCVVIQIRTQDRDGYEAVQLGFGEKPRRLASRSERGQVARINSKRQKAQESAGVELLPKPGCEPNQFVREFRTDGEEHGLDVGQSVSVGIFAGEESSSCYVDVIGTSKGRGTAGVMKRHNFQGQRASHGVKRVHRHGGSIGMSADPARVFKGTKMPGRYGHSRITIRHLQVLKIDEANNMLVVKGAVPGPNGGFLVIRHTNKR